MNKTFAAIGIIVSLAVYQAGWMIVHEKFDFENQTIVIGENSSKPKIPTKKISPKVPKIGSQKNLKASILEASDDGGKEIIDEINASLSIESISVDDINRGWYLSNEDDKKVGTPDKWIWLDEEGGKWISTEKIEQLTIEKTEALCSDTGGTYAKSCLENETECEFIPESVCRCPAQTKWEESEGCLAVDEEGEFVEIKDEEIKQGYYTGWRSQKKHYTPTHWIWQGDITPPKWKNPGKQ